MATKHSFDNSSLYANGSKTPPESIDSAISVHSYNSDYDARSVGQASIGQVIDKHSDHEAAIAEELAATERAESEDTSTTSKIFMFLGVLKKFVGVKDIGTVYVSMPRNLPCPLGFLKNAFAHPPISFLSFFCIFVLPTAAFPSLPNCSNLLETWNIGTTTTAPITLHGMDIDNFKAYTCFNLPFVGAERNADKLCFIARFCTDQFVLPTCHTFICRSQSDVITSRDLLSLADPDDPLERMLGVIRWWYSKDLKYVVCERVAFLILPFWLVDYCYIEFFGNSDRATK